MRRRLLMLLLGLGAIGGFASGVASMGHCHTHGGSRQAAFERHVADVCVNAARRDDSDRHHHHHSD